jgi:GT2 family glycosyltransferase
VQFVVTPIFAQPERASTVVPVAPRHEIRASVIIVNYNSGELLKQCLHALVPECGQADETIVVDNASTDQSVRDVVDAFPGARIVGSDANLGFGAGNNLGMRFATGKYLAFLNPDTVVQPGWLTRLIAALETNPRVGLATSKILLRDVPRRINTCGNDIHCSGLTLCRGAGLDSNALSDPSDVGAVSGAAFVIRRELFELLGGFDGTFFLYMEDTDLSLRARLAGYRCVYAPDSVVYHDYALSFGPRKTFYQERNRYLMLLKALRWRTLIVLLPTLLLAEGVTWGFVILRDRQHFGNKLRAYAWIARHWGEIRERRRRTQALRRVPDRDLIADSTHRLAYEQADDSIAARLAHALLDPVFFAFHRLALAVVRW